VSIFRPRTATVITDQPPKPADRRLAFTVTPGDAVCVLRPQGDRPVDAITATGQGHQTFTVPGAIPGWGSDFDVTADGYEPFHAFLTLPTTDTELPAITLVRTVVALPPLVRQGQFYYQADGSPFTVIEASQFRAFERFLNGEDLSPVFGQLQAEGFNTIRVWLLNTSVGHIVPAEHPDFYDRLPAFLAHAARFGLYVELTVFTQTQSLMPTRAAQQAHYDATVQGIGATFCFVEGGNEVDSHDNAFDPRLRLWKPAGATFDLCRGSNGADAWAVEPVIDSARYHSNDTNEWWRRQAHNGMEIAAAFGEPCIANENTRPDRDGNQNHHRDAAAGAALLSAGSCLHSESGKHSRVMDGADLACARAFVAGARSVDLSQRTAGYVHRTDLEGPTVIRAYQRGSAVVIIGA
jgi:hypothetical protein